MILGHSKMRSKLSNFWGELIGKLGFKLILNIILKVDFARGKGG